MSLTSRDDSIDLANSAREVDRALAAFMEQRSRACSAQAQAMKLYDAEMHHIMKEVEQEEIKSRISSPARNIDHNILRSINATGDEPGGHKLEIEDDSLASKFEQQSCLDSKIGSSSMISNMGAPIKKPPPTPTERISIRKQMLSFFEGSRDSEIDRFNELDVLLGGDDPKKTVVAVEELFREQTSNYGQLMSFLDDYQPEPFVKAWGNDPDYKKLMKKYKIDKSGESFKARATLATMKHKSSRKLNM